MSACSVALAAFLCASTSTRIVAGMPVQESIQAAGKTLHLNGAGVRRVAIFGAYLVALYLEEPEKDAEAVVASEKIKVVRLIFRLNISKKDVMEEFELGIRNNSPQELLPDLFHQLDLVRPIIPNMKRGQLLSFVYRPGRGTTVSVKGGKSVVVPGKDFADALLRSVVGKKPYDDKMKEDLLHGW